MACQMVGSRRNSGFDGSIWRMGRFRELWFDGCDSYSSPCHCHEYAHPTDGDSDKDGCVTNRDPDIDEL